MTQTIRVCITGHRPNKLGGYSPHNPMKYKIQGFVASYLTSLRTQGYEPTLLTGMAIGVDQWAAEKAIELSVAFEAFLPCKGQESRWPPLAQETYRELLIKSSQSILVYDGDYTSNPGCMRERNLRMLKTCDMVLAFWDGSNNGGTAHCVATAVAMGLPILHYSTTTGTASWLQDKQLTLPGLEKEKVVPQESLLFLPKGTDMFGIETTYVIPVNCLGVSGKGLALQAKTLYPEQEARYAGLCKKGGLKPGLLFFASPCLYFPTKLDWRNPSKLEYIQLGMDKFATCISDGRLSTDKPYIFPPLGCGLGGLQWVEVRNIIAEALQGLKGTFYVVEGN